MRQYSSADSRPMRENYADSVKNPLQHTGGHPKCLGGPPVNRDRRNALPGCRVAAVAEWYRYRTVALSRFGLATKTPRPEGSSPYAFTPSLASGSQKITPP
ncbi:hypothetical protein TNCV_2315001 [Trichonephila clavipes]|nr:hypothetical protein TNCV_2315001 [Trichonephila clavipes]